MNDAPTTSGDKAFSTTENGPVVAGTLTGDDIDSDDDPGTLSFVLSALSGKGTLTDNGDGTFKFDPGNDFDSLGADDKEDVTFTYQTKDGHSALSAPATVTITVTGTNDAPVAKDVTADAKEDGAPVTASYAVIDVDDPAGKFTFAITQQPAEGTVTDNGDGTFSFDPGSGFQELAEGKTTTVSFKYTATDPGGATSNEATGTITVTGVNDCTHRHRQAVLDHRGRAGDCWITRRRRHRQR